MQGQDPVTIEEAVMIASDGVPGPVVYSPTVDKILNSGSTSIVGLLSNLPSKKDFRSESQDSNHS